jgi:hypothetical protein
MRAVGPFPLDCAVDGFALSPFFGFISIEKRES